MANSTAILAYKTINGVSAIWFEYNNRNWIVNPCELFNGMLVNEYSPLLYFNVDNFVQGKPSYYVKQDFNGEEFVWIFKQLLGNPECEKRFEYKDFWNKSKIALLSLCRDMESNKPAAYDGVIEKEELKKIANQLDITEIFFMPYRPRTSEITEEKLSFVCPIIDENEEAWSLDIPYILRIGNREIISNISEWSNDMDFIRYQLESYCYCGKAEIELHYEDEPTTIHLNKVSALNSAKSVGRSGVVYDYTDFMKVTIQPNSFVKGAAVTGFCDEKATVRELYEGLLNVARVGYKFNPNEVHDNDWDYSPIVFYNHIKSPIVEKYVDGIEDSFDAIVIRQQIIHNVFTICPDYSHVLGTMLGQSAVVEVLQDNVVSFYDENDEKELYRVTIPGLYEWLDEFNRLSDGQNQTMGTMNVDNWHQRGLILAKELKKALPEMFDLWYGYPYEDVEHRNNRPILITNGNL